MPLSINRNNQKANPFNDSKYNAIFDEFYTPLCQYCMKFIHDRDIVEDIVQEQFVYLWEHWERLQDIESTKAYLYKSVKNRSINFLTRKSTRVKQRQADESELLNEKNDLPNAQEILEADDLEIILKKALDSLPEKCRNIFTLKRFGELTNKEVAEKLNISVKTVEAQMTIAIKRLKTFVGKHWGVVAIFTILFWEKIFNLF